MTIELIEPATAAGDSTALAIRQDIAMIETALTEFDKGLAELRKDFAEFQRAAAAERDITLTQLRELLTAARAREAEAQRLADDRAEFEREQKAEAERRLEQARQDAAQRGERAQQDAKDRAAEHQDEREQRERETSIAEQVASVDAEQRLRNAAPRLLAELQSAVRWVGSLTDWEGAGDPPIEQWQAAIDAATAPTTTEPQHE